MMAAILANGRELDAPRVRDEDSGMMEVSALIMAIARYLT